MSNVLIAYATSEGQTAKICNVLARQLEAAAHYVQLVDLSSGNQSPDVDFADAVVVAGSVHTGKHQDNLIRFVTDNRHLLTMKRTAFLSVSIAAAATDDSGQQRADEQVHTFLEQTGWQPGQVEKLGGAFRYSQFSRLKRWAFGLVQRLFRKNLDQEGWPDLTADEEYTDWKQLERFSREFAARLANR